jgi:hypothetical protein
VKNQPCNLCFYKFYSEVKKVSSFCMLHKERIDDCSDFKNNILINGEFYHFIDPLSEPDLDKQCQTRHAAQG